MRTKPVTQKHVDETVKAWKLKHSDCFNNPCGECRLSDELIEEIFQEEALIEMLIAWMKIFAA